MPQTADPNSPKAPTIFTKDFIAVSLINFFIMLSFYVLLIMSAPYARERFLASPSVAGFVTGSLILGAIVGRFITGGFIHTVSFHKVLIGGAIGSIVTAALYLVADSLPLLVGVRLLNGIAIGGISTATGTIIAHIIPPQFRGRGISYFSLSSIAAMALGPFLGIFLLPRASFTTLFMLCLFCGAICLCIVPFVGVKRNAPSSSTQAAPQHTGLRRYVAYRAVPISLALMIAGISYGCVQAYIFFYVKELDLMSEGSVYFLLYAIAAFALRPLAGKIFDTRGENAVVYPSLCIMAGSLFLLGVANNAVVLLISGAMLGMGFGVFQSTAQSVAIKCVPTNRFGQATSTCFMALDLGAGLGPTLLGAFIPSIGYSGLYLAAGGIALLAIALYHVLHGRTCLNKSEEL